MANLAPVNNICLLTHSFWKLPIICNVCLQINEIRLYHFLPKCVIPAFSVSLTDEVKLVRCSSLSILMTVSSTTGLEFWLLVEVSAWCSRNSVSAFQNLNAKLPLLAPEPIKFHKNLEPKNVDSSWLTSETSILSFTGLVWGGSIKFGSESLWYHKPTLVIYNNGLKVCHLFSKTETKEHG